MAHIQVENLPDTVTPEEFEALSLRYALGVQIKKNDILERKIERLQKAFKKLGTSTAKNAAR